MRSSMGTKAGGVSDAEDVTDGRVDPTRHAARAGQPDLCGFHPRAAARTNELPEARMWRLATEGEANLVLGNSELSLQRYEQALAGPPKPKPGQFTSTSQQALRIADQLGDEEIARRLLELFKTHQP